MRDYTTFIAHKTTSEHFRDELLLHYPALKKDKQLLKLAIWLIFSRFKDDETENIVIPSELLASIEGKLDEFDSRNYLAWELISEFATKVTSISITSWSYTSNKAREVDSVSWKKEVVKLINQELRNELGGKRVFLLSGEPYNRKALLKRKALQKFENIYTLRHKPVVEQVFIAEYINALPLGVFEAMYSKNIDNALLTAKRLENADHHLGVLHNLRDDAKPIVKFVANSPRLFASGMTLMNLKSEPRKVLMTGTTDIDVRNCQLRIAGKLWDIPELKPILKDGRSFWDYVGGIINLEKKQIKTATYSILFGGSKRLLNKQLGERQAELMELPIFKAIIKSRNKRMREVRKQAGCFNAFGKWLKTDGSNKSLRSIIAQEIQSYELQIMTKAFEIACKRDDGAIILYQYDGVSVIGTPEFEQAISQVLEQTTIQLGI